MNYKKVIEHFKNGKIDKNDWLLVIDNDGGYWNYIGENIGGYEEDLMREEMEEKYGEPEGYSDVVEILIAAGVNAEWV